ncbi:MAG: WD40 repeat domain-containing protein [Promethearchaeia archaeon]
MEFKIYLDSIMADNYFLGGIKLLPNNEMVISYSGYNIKHWNLSDKKLIQHIYSSDLINIFNISPDGKFLLGGGKKFIKIWDLNSGELIKTFNDKKGVIYSLIMTGDGKYIISCNSNGIVKIRDFFTKNIIKTIKLHKSSAVSNLYISKDGKYLIVSKVTKYIKVYDIDSFNLIGEINDAIIFYAPENISIYPMKNLLCFTSEYGIKIWNFEKDEIINVYNIKNKKNKYFSFPFFSNDGKYLIATTGRLIASWDMNTGELKNVFEYINPWNKANYIYLKLLISPDNKYLFGKTDDELIIWDFNNGEIIQTFKGGYKAIMEYLISDDLRNYTIIGYDDHNIILWELEMY